jgi:type IV pilus assembly protein PilW
MVGMAVGLLVVAVALVAMAQHLHENRRLLAQTRLLQDLRTVSDLILRDLRRAGPIAVDDEGVRFTGAAGGEPLAYRLRTGVLEMRIGNGAWQAMTDADTLRVSSFRVDPSTHEIPLATFCSRPCPPDSADCPPRQQSRSLALQIEATAPQDPALSRRLTSTLKLRHDLLLGACPA